MKDLAAALDIVIEKAPALRAAGVRRVSVDGIELELAPGGGDMELPIDRDDDEEDGEVLSPLDDPATFGRRKGVPTLRTSTPDVKGQRS